MVRRNLVSFMIVVLFLLGVVPLFSSNDILSASLGVGLTFKQRDALNVFDDNSPGYNATFVGLGDYTNSMFGINFIGSLYFVERQTPDISFSYANPFFSTERWEDQQFRILMYAGPSLGFNYGVIQVEASAGLLFEGRAYKGPYEDDSSTAIWGQSIGTSYAITYGPGVNVAATYFPLIQKVKKNGGMEFVPGGSGFGFGCLLGVISGERTLKAAQSGDFKWSEGNWNVLVHPYIFLHYGFKPYSR
jgi:hypothetical protein